MDYSLRWPSVIKLQTTDGVLILILMDYSLSSAKKKFLKELALYVLILILMDYSLSLTKTTVVKAHLQVLILILMDYSLSERRGI